MIELRGEHVVLRALEREHCHTLWEMMETAEDVPTEHVQLGLEGHQRNAFFFGGRWYDRVIFSILEAEYRQLSDVQMTTEMKP